VTVFARLTWLHFHRVVRTQAALATLSYTVLAALLLPVLAEISLGAADRTVIDLGLLGAQTAASLTALIAGLGAVGPAVRRGEAATWLALPIARPVWVLARTLGALGAAASTLVACTAAWCALALMLGVHIPGNLWAFIIEALSEAAILTALGTFAGTALSTPIATLTSVVAVTLGHLGGLYADIPSPNRTLRLAGQVVRWTVPQLERYSIQAELVQNLPISTIGLASDALHALAWAAALFLGTSLVLSRRDL